MSIREELIREIEQAPDELLQVLLSCLRQTQISQSRPSPSSINPEMENAKLSDEQRYPLRGLPLIISEDFDEPMGDLWDELGS